MRAGSTMVRPYILSSYPREYTGHYEIEQSCSGDDFIFFIYLLEGIMYQLVVPFLSLFGRQLIYYQTIPYVLVMPLVARVIDRSGFRPAMLNGTVLLGLVMGVGLGIYIASIRIGTSLNAWVVPYSQNNYLLSYLIALAILLLSVLLVQWVSDYEPREVEKRRHMEQLSDYYSEKSEELREARQVQYGMLQADRHMTQGFQVAAMSETEKKSGAICMTISRWMNGGFCSRSGM